MFIFFGFSGVIISGCKNELEKCVSDPRVPRQESNETNAAQCQAHKQHGNAGSATLTSLT